MKKEDLKIVFMGTPEFAVANLKSLVETGYKIVGVITAPDRPAGRGQKLNESAVKRYAKSQGLTILQPTNLKSEDFISELRSLEANIQIVVAFRMLPKMVWAMPDFGTFNLHASLLPDYRGAAPIHWAIINGETKTGVTTFFIDEKIDTGAIILQEQIDILPDETVGSLHDKLMDLGSELILKTVEQILNENFSTEIQPKSKDLKTAYKLNNENCKIDWQQDVEIIYNMIRGLNPFPAAWCYLKNGDEKLRVKIFGIEMNREKHKFDFGTVIADNKKLMIAAKNGYILVNEIQLPGKRKMDVKSLLNGFHIKEDSKML